MSLLLAEGHAAAQHYPLAVVWSEARLVRQRLAFRRRQETALMQLCIASVFDQKASKQLAKLLRRLDESD